uniref:Uncharacterized protein n=1 Tax=Alexandrium monilatum TaxID=311494 RepID=A0A7S4VBP1_9DINO
MAQALSQAGAGRPIAPWNTARSTALVREGMAAVVRTGDKYAGHATELGTYVRVKIPRRECICWDDYEEAGAAPKPAPGMTSAPRLSGVDLKAPPSLPSTMDRLPPRQRGAAGLPGGASGLPAPFPAETLLRHEMA